MYKSSIHWLAPGCVWMCNTLPTSPDAASSYCSDLHSPNTLLNTSVDLSYTTCFRGNVITGTHCGADLLGSGKYTAASMRMVRQIWSELWKQTGFVDERGSEENSQSGLSWQRDYSISYNHSLRQKSFPQFIIPQTFRDWWTRTGEDHVWFHFLSARNPSWQQTLAHRCK